tara:strand:- start:297 stop:404 length:108 start_codon:yes stop_codon:yes gene_type:complete
MFYFYLFIPDVSALFEKVKTHYSGYVFLKTWILLN